ncbi:hypothetical protein APHAL10511_001198 [Amanita phalloides]|nr:hypothetical protein APHAL10511_001198 [Amanita phalloides]
MCHNVIDGRYHTECGHFYAMNTIHHDCRQPNCLFSGQHAHPTVKNPIRISPTICSDCTTKGRTGTSPIQ